MKKFNLICEILSGELNKNIPLITEHIYFDSLFEKLINYCKTKLIISNEILILTYNELITFIDSHWSGKKYLKKNKIVYILFYENLKEITWLTEYELNKINEQMKYDDGIFCSDFEKNENISLIILNDISIGEYTRVLTHELIHFFQWNIGKSIYQFKTSILSIEEIKEISEILKLDTKTIESMIKHIQTPYELESYCNNIFDYLKDFCKQNHLLFNKFVIKAICDCCFNKNNEKFADFYKTVILNFKQYLNIDIIFDTKYLIYILLLGYFKHGFNSFKNHLFGYLNKSQNEK